MKFTRQELQKIIQEELQKAIEDGEFTEQELQQLQEGPRTAGVANVFRQGYNRLKDKIANTQIGQDYIKGRDAEIEAQKQKQAAAKAKAAAPSPYQQAKSNVAASIPAGSSNIELAKSLSTKGQANVAKFQHVPASPTQPAAVPQAGQKVQTKRSNGSTSIGTLLSPEQAKNHPSYQGYDDKAKNAIQNGTLKFVALDNQTARASKPEEITPVTSATAANTAPTPTQSSTAPAPTTKPLSRKQRRAAAKAAAKAARKSAKKAKNQASVPQQAATSPFSSKDTWAKDAADVYGESKNSVSYDKLYENWKKYSKG